MHEEWTLLKRLIWLWRVVKGGASSVLKTVTGALIHITDALAKPAHELVAVLSPKQEGSGDPSPDNVRPISGWTGCEITLTGKNLLNVLNQKPSSYIDADGVEHSQSGFFYTLDFTPVVPGDTYAISWKKVSGNINLALYFYDVNKNFIGRQSFGAWTADRLYVPDANTRFIRFQGDYTVGQCQIEKGSSFTDYEPYKANVLPITFTDPTTGDPLTVYGGTLTLNEDGSVDLVSEYGVIDLSSVSWNYSTPQKRFYKSGYSDYDFGTYQSSEPNFLCNVYAPTKWASHVPGSGPDLTCGGSSGYISIRDLRYDDTSVSAFKSYLAEIGAVFVAILATPQTYHFDNVGQLQLFLGENNIWVDVIQLAATFLPEVVQIKFSALTGNKIVIRPLCKAITFLITDECLLANCSTFDICGVLLRCRSE